MANRAFDFYEMRKQEAARPTGYNQVGAVLTGTVSANGSRNGSMPVLTGPSTTDQTVLFDSKYILSTSDAANGFLQFRVADMANLQQIVNCVAIKINSFTVPTPATNPDTQPGYFSAGRAYMYLTGLSTTQGIQCADFSPCFEFDVETNDTVARFIPTFESIYFAAPIKTINEISFRFCVPPTFGAVPLRNYKISVAAVPRSNPATFTLVFQSNLADVAELAEENLAVVFDKFQSGNAALDLQMSSLAGYFVSGQPASFSIQNVSFAALSAPVVCDMYIQKNRIAPMLRFSCINSNVPNDTPNGITISHS